MEKIGLLALILLINKFKNNLKLFVLRSVVMDLILGFTNVMMETQETKMDVIVIAKRKKDLNVMKKDVQIRICKWLLNILD